MSVSSEDVRHIARLARLDLTAEEVERFRHELSTILAYVEQLDAVEAGHAADPDSPDQRLRADAVVPWPDLEALLDAAPDLVAGYFRVPRVIE
jgi:aspartyl-tRNA(Asn)/glutamyl-tRNA(Gln) amidotransferase subunit C